MFKFQFKSYLGGLSKSFKIEDFDVEGNVFPEPQNKVLQATKTKFLSAVGIFDSWLQIKDLSAMILRSHNQSLQNNRNLDFDAANQRFACLSFAPQKIFDFLKDYGGLKVE